MKKNRLSVFILALTLVSLLFSCGGKYEESGQVIVSAREAITLINEGGWTVIDTQKDAAYEKEHVKGALLIPRASVVISEPVANCVAPKSVIEANLGAAGLSESDNVIIYDANSNMDAGRLFWTLLSYGHKGEIKVVSGGLLALRGAGADMGKGAASPKGASYSASAFDTSYYADKKEMLKQINEDNDDVVFIDVRTDDEWFDGTVPGSLHINYTENLFKDKTIRPVTHIRILYKEEGIMPSDTVYMYCKTSIRAAMTFVALYDAGYRNIKIYDGAWLEWSGDESLPQYKPERNDPALLATPDNS